ncbi:hypothetical protein Q0M94_27335 (plasmid) [Deinococcus radiomollis]|uniref:hypothetical protein n=1 Tax=Deinococcus radiomollis TaxID=468916 RepID=UPI0038915E81
MMPARQVLPTHFSFAAPDAVYGVLETSEAAERLCSDLRQLGFGEAQVLHGPKGLHDLDEDGSHHGPLFRLARLLQGLTREREFIEHYASQLYAGRAVLNLRISGHARLAELREAFQRNGRRAVNHYSRLTVCILCP